VYPASKLFLHVMKGLESKNSRTRTECLDEIASLLQRNGMNVFGDRIISEMLSEEMIELLVYHINHRPLKHLDGATTSCFEY
jgi:cytoskeleton-associated protein 5